MKTFFNTLLLAGVCLMVFVRCEKDEDKTILRIGESSTLFASTHSVVMTEDVADDNAIAFTWTAPDFGYAASIDYTLELSLTEDFESTVTSDAGTAATRLEYTVEDFNKLAVALGLQPGTAQDILVRLKATVTNTEKYSYSEPIVVNAQVYVAEPPYATLYMVGPATANDWDATLATPMFRDETDPFVYRFTGYFEAGELKALGYLNTWIPQWGTSGDGKLAVKDSDGDTDPASIVVPANGYYTFSMNLKFNTYTLTAYDASGADTYAVVGIAGSFDGWANSTPLASTAANPHIWSAEYTLSADSDVKFTTPSWSPQWGISSNWTSLYGKSDLGGSGNMWVLAGTYRFLFNDLDGRYLLIKK